MSVRIWFLRVARYYRRNGLCATLFRIPEKIGAILTKKADILYSADLTEVDPHRSFLSMDMTVSRIRSLDRLEAGEAEALRGYCGASIFDSQAVERFQRGAVLWIVKIDGSVAGMMWTIKGGTVRPHYMVLADSDVHLFNIEIFENYRGRGIMPKFAGQVLLELKKDGLVRAFAETNAANTGAVRAFGKTPFKPLAEARLVRVGGRSITIWSKTSACSCRRGS